jgi:hypothetical protein
VVRARTAGGPPTANVVELAHRLDALGSQDGRLLRMLVGLGIRIAHLESPWALRRTEEVEEIGVKEAAWRLKCSPTGVRKRMAKGTTVGGKRSLAGRS